MDFISPLDGRYRNLLDGIPTARDRLKFQACIEYDWVVHIASKLGYPIYARPFEFTQKFVDTIKMYEKQTDHDIKAIEMAVAYSFFEEKDHWLCHFGLTSEDINSFGNTYIMGESTHLVIAEIQKIICTMDKFCNLLYKVAARTHGQHAVPTTYAQRFGVYKNGLNNLCMQLKIPNFVKFGGAIGDFNEATTALSLVKKMNFMEIVSTFHPFESGKYVREYSTFQTSLYTKHAEHFNQLSVVCLFLQKILADLWDGISRGHFIIIRDKNFVGSSVMSQKVNPKNFENAEANFSMAVMWATQFTNLIKFRLERDLRDSTQLRYLSQFYSHIIIGLKNMAKDLKSLEPSDYQKSESEIETNGQIFSAVVQTYLRLQGTDKAYEILRQLTQNKIISRTELYQQLVPYFKPEWYGDLYRIMEYQPIKINTTNNHKQTEFQKFFKHYGFEVSFSSIDIPEPDASHEEIIVYKASSAYSKQSTKSVRIFCEDTALFIEGAPETGVNIKFHINNINDYAGRNASFVVLLGYADGKDVYIYRGQIDGKIIHSDIRSEFGFDANFVPDGAAFSYSVSKPMEMNSRFLAVSQVVKNSPHMVCKFKDICDVKMQKSN